MERQTDPLYHQLAAGLDWRSRLFPHPGRLRGTCSVARSTPASTTCRRRRHRRHVNISPLRHALAVIGFHHLRLISANRRRATCSQKATKRWRLSLELFAARNSRLILTTAMNWVDFRSRYYGRWYGAATRSVEFDAGLVTVVEFRALLSV
jgi:hypothetical protein